MKGKLRRIWRGIKTVFSEQRTETDRRKSGPVSSFTNLPGQRHDKKGFYRNKGIHNESMVTDERSGPRRKEDKK